MISTARLLGSLALLCASVGGLVACSGSGGGGAAQVTMAVADAPVDGATAVVVKFTGVQLIPADGGSPVAITFAQPKTIDLLTQSGTASAILFNQPIPAGSYGQVRLLVTADGDPANSYIVLSGGGTDGLLVPSGAQTGLKLVTGFTVPASGVVDYTIDFDLRQAITCPPGLAGQTPVCILKPVERLVDDSSVGNIQGAVSNTLVVSTTTSTCSPGVYLYNGTVTVPEDMNSSATTPDPNQPLSTSAPVANSQPPYYYQFTFLPPGNYTLAFTCQANQDNPAQADSAVKFSPVKTGIVVTAGQTTTADLP